MDRPTFMPRRRQVAALAGLAVAAPRAATAAEIQLRAADGTAIFGEHRLSARRETRGVILLFHMAGSNFGEYSTIGPELARRGFESLAIDQRSGGDGWGRQNRTAAAFPRDPGYRAALPDLEAALAWARRRSPTGPVILWGSSYSAALVFLVASAMGPAVSALLAFSPGEYLGGAAVRQAAERVRCPVFVTSASDPAEEAAAESLLAVTRGAPRRQFRPAMGVHGSPTLRPDRNPQGMAAAWTAVDGFLDEVAPAG